MNEGLEGSAMATAVAAAPAKFRVRAAAGLWALLLAATLLPMARGHAAPPAAATSTPPAEASAEATARYFNRDVITFRSTLLGRPPAVRARFAEESIARVVDRPGDAKLSFATVPQGLAVMLDNQIITLMVPADLDASRGQTMAGMRQDIVRDLGRAVAAAEHEKGPKQIARGIALSALAIVLAIVVLAWLPRAGDRARDWYARWIARRADALHSDPARHVVQSSNVAVSGLLYFLRWAVALVTLEEMLRFVLGQFGYTRPWAESMTGWLADLFTGWGRAALDAVPGLFAAIAILLIARLVARTISLSFHGVQNGSFNLFGIDAQLAEPTRKIVIAVVWLFAIAMAYPYLPGAQTEAFKGLSVMVGLMISLGASSIVGQAAGGFTLLYARTMQPGDLVRIGDAEGFVQQVGLFTTRIRTMTGVEVSFPNNVVLGGELRNFSRHPDGQGLWLETAVTIGYGAPWRQVHRLLLDAAAKTAHVQAEPAPLVLQRALGNFSVDYQLRVRIQDPGKRYQVLGELHGNIQDQFNAAGVQIMAPNYEADPETPKLVPQEWWEALPGPGAAGPGGKSP